MVEATHLKNIFVNFFIISPRDPGWKLPKHPETEKKRGFFVFSILYLFGESFSRHTRTPQTGFFQDKLMARIEAWSFSSMVPKLSADLLKKFGVFRDSTRVGLVEPICEINGVKLLNSALHPYKWPILDSWWLMGNWRYFMLFHPTCNRSYKGYNSISNW